MKIQVLTAAAFRPTEVVRRRARPYHVRQKVVPGQAAAQARAVRHRRVAHEAVAAATEKAEDNPIVNFK